MASDITALVSRHLELKEAMARLKAELADIDDEIVRAVPIPEGKQSTALEAGGHKVRVAASTRYKWDQGKLDMARLALGDEKFLRLFGYEWKGRKKEVDGFLANAPEPMARKVRDALTVMTSYSVTVEEG